MRWASPSNNARRKRAAGATLPAMDERPDVTEQYITLPIKVKRVESSTGRYLAVCGSIDAAGDTPDEAVGRLKKTILEASFEW